MKSEEVKIIIDAEENDIDAHIFVKKKDESYFFEKESPDKKSVQQAKMKNKNGKELPIVHMNMVSKLYHYIIKQKIEI